MQENNSRRAALLIPGGWIIHENELYEEEPILTDGTINPHFNDSQDILWIEQLNFKELARYILSVAEHNRMLVNSELTMSKKLSDADKKLVLFFDLGWYGESL